MSHRACDNVVTTSAVALRGTKQEKPLLDRRSTRRQPACRASPTRPRVSGHNRAVHHRGRRRGTRGDDWPRSAIRTAARLGRWARATRRLFEAIAQPPTRSPDGEPGMTWHFVWLCCTRHAHPTTKVVRRDELAPTGWWGTRCRSAMRSRENPQKPCRQLPTAAIGVEDCALPCLTEQAKARCYS